MSESPPLLDLEIDRAVSARIDHDWLHDHIERALAHLAEGGNRISRVTIAIVGDDRMTLLHKQHQGIETTTDVLTFPMSSLNEPVDVDIAVCADVADRAAKERGHSIERELLLYVIHGVLHCLGYDDHDESSFAAMHQREDEILDAIGVGPTFSKREHEGHQP